MISKGTTHKNGGKLARYFVTGKDGERAELWELRGFASPDIVEAFCSVHVIAEATKAEAPFFHIQVRNPDGETLSREQWEYSANRIERMLGLKDQPRAIAFHVNERTGEEHMHVAWSRIDEETLTAIPLPFYKERLKKISRELEMHFGLTLVPNERDSTINYAPTRAEDEQGRRLGLNPHEIRQTIRDCYDRSDCGRSFEAALADEGMVLARGDRRDYLVIDQASGMHALGKRMLDVSAADVRNRLGDLDRELLPTVAEAQAFIREQAATRKVEEPAAIWDRDRAEVAWQTAIVDAAIEKARAQSAHGSETVGHGRSETPELGWTAGEIRLARTLTGGPEAFANAIEDRGLFLARVAAADLPILTEIEKRRVQENDAHYKHQRRQGGSAKPRYKEHDLVIVNQFGDVFTLTPRNTGLGREALEAYTQQIDAAPLLTVTETWAVIKDLQQHRREEALWEKQAPEIFELERQAFRDLRGAGVSAREVGAPPEDLRGVALRLWEAEARSDSPQAFADALIDHKLAFAVVTKKEAERSYREAAFAQEIGRYAQRYKEGEVVAISEPPPSLRSEHGEIIDQRRVHKLDPLRAEKYLSKLGIDSGQLKGIDATKQTLDARALDRAAFWEGIKLDNATTVNPNAHKQATKGALGEAQTQAAGIGRKAIEAVAHVASEGIEMLGNLFGATAMTRERINAAIHENEIAADDQKIDLARFRSDADYRRQVEASEAQKIEQDRQRRYYEEHQERQR